MQHIPSDDVINFSISLYKNVGESMTTRDGVSILLHLYRAFNFGVMIIILVSIVANLFHVESGMYITTIEGSLTIIHVGMIHNCVVLCTITTSTINILVS